MKRSGAPGIVRGALAALIALAGAPVHGADAKAELGRKVFTELAQPSCTICHALKDAGSTGTVGPSLDELKPDLNRVMKAVRDGVGVMPAFGGTLSEAQIAAVAHYVTQASAAKP